MPPGDHDDQPAVDLNTGIEVVGRAECLQLLAGEEVGRLGVVVEGKPEIFPVNYVLDDYGIVFRTGPGTKSSGILASPVVFEVDGVDRVTGSGWSVVVHGRARTVFSAEATQLRGVMTRWAVHPGRASDKPLLFQIVPVTVSGRRIRGATAPREVSTG